MHFNHYIKSELENSNLSSIEKNLLKDFLSIEDSNKYFDYTNEELNHIFQIAKFNSKLQIEMWLVLPNKVVNNGENLKIFEDILDNKFGEYINEIDKSELVKLLNGSRGAEELYDDRGNRLYKSTSLLKQMNSSVFDNGVAIEAFSFNQLLEIVSNEKNEKFLELVLKHENSRDLLLSIGKDLQGWQSKFQYIMDLTDSEYEFIRNEKLSRFIDDFGTNGEKIVETELKLREEIIKTGSIEIKDEETNEVLDYYDDEFACIMRAVFGIFKNEAEELLRKYGKDLEKLNIQTDTDKKVYRKLQIMKELMYPGKFESYEEEEKYYKDYCYLHKDELLQISKDVSPFYKIDMERSFLDLYARQYDRALGVNTNKIKDISYNGKIIPVYEATGDFMILIRGEQNISSKNERNFWNGTKLEVKGLCQSTIGQDYLRFVDYGNDDECFIGTTSCKGGELRMASTTNIKSGKTNILLSTLGIGSNYENGFAFRIPKEQINNSRGGNNETITAKNIYNSQTGLYERNNPDYIIYIQETNDANIDEDPRFKTAQFAASEMCCPILIIPREKYAQREEERIQELKEKLLGQKERLKDETDESIIRDMIVEFNNNREGILTSKGLKENYFTEEKHIELVGTINARLSQLKNCKTKEYENLVKTVSGIYKEEIEKYYAFSYDRTDVKGLEIDSTREHLKPYEDFLMAHERNMFDLSNSEKNIVFSTIKNISQTTYYDMNEYHSLSHIQKVIMFAEILAKNENLSKEETTMLLAAAAFHDSGRDGKEDENDNHALASANQVCKYLEENPNNPFDITSKNISIIQAAIEYHEHKEPEKGVTDFNELQNLCYKYNIADEEFLSLKKVSNLLKDADALDRARFGKKNENRWSLDARYLKSDTAKSISMLRFSEECNARFKEEEIPSESIALDGEKILRSELDEFDRPKIQISSIKEVTKKITATQKRNVMNAIVRIKSKIQTIFHQNNEIDNR